MSDDGGPLLGESNSSHHKRGYGPVPVSWVKHCAKQFIQIISFHHLNDYALGIVTGPLLWMITLKHK